MVVRKRHFQRIERQVDVGAVLVTARRRVALHHLHRVFGQRAGRVFLASPVGVCDLGDDLAALFQGVQHGGHVEIALQCRFDADFDVVKIDEHCDLEFVFHSVIPLPCGRHRAPFAPTQVQSLGLRVSCKARLRRW